jgi:murein DD-endopeptidase MepM/ murein hydrolase activator NlpD
MTPFPATPSLLRGLVLVVVLSLLPALVGPDRALGAEPFATGRSSPVQDTPDPVGVWPLAPVPEVVGGFDPPSVPWGAGHRGVDLLGSVGQRVRSALPGTVSFAGRIAGRGVVVVAHGDTRTTYEPVTAALAVGTPIAAGAPLGRLELAGSHCFPRACLHWGWRRGETYLDPLRLVGAGPVRLLPLWRAEPVDASLGFGARPTLRWRPPVLPYAAWRPPVRDPPPLRRGGAPAGRRGAAGRW